MQKPMVTIRLQAHSTTPIYAQVAQTIREQIARGALPVGAVLPTVRELAQQLKVNQNTIARAYRLLHAEGLLDAHARQGTRVAAADSGEHLRAARDAELHVMVSRLIGEALGHGFTLSELEAAFVGQRARWQTQQTAFRANALAASAQRLGLGSHDICLELLLTQFQQTYETPVLSFTSVGSMAGLMALARGAAHFAAAHLYDAASDDYNLPFVRQLLPRQRCTLITLAQREQGWLVAKGNPRKIHSLKDLTRRGVRYVNRQRGSGTRALLDGWMRKERIPQRKLQGYTREEQTHLAVAAAIANQSADVGLGIRAAARVYELDFVPLTHERFELVMLQPDDLIPMLQDVMARAEFKLAVAALGGYDLSECGRVRHT